jgi:hypothetical protein
MDLAFSIAKLTSTCKCVFIFIKAMAYMYTYNDHWPLKLMLIYPWQLKVKEVTFRHAGLTSSTFVDSGGIKTYIKRTIILNVTQMLRTR